MMTGVKKLQTWILMSFLAILMLTACQDSADPENEALLTENMVLTALEDRNIPVDETGAVLTIQIYPTIWEALQEHRQTQSLGESFFYRESENRFRYWVKNAIIILQYEEVDAVDFNQILIPIGQMVFEELNPMQEVALVGETENWAAKVPVRYYAYSYEDEEGEEQLAEYYELEVELAYQGSVENPFHELEVTYEMAQQDGYRLSAIESVIGPAEEVLGEDGVIALSGFNRSGPEHPLRSDHTLYLTDFYGEGVKIRLEPGTTSYKK